MGMPASPMAPICAPTGTPFRQCRDRARLADVRDVDVEYVVLEDGASIAYEVFGSGPVDVLVNVGIWPIDLMWDLPQLAEFMDALGRVARVIAFDPRGIGASDPLPTTASGGGMEHHAASRLAVLDAAGAERATLFDLSQGTTSVFFAATYPERIRSLILPNLRPSYPELRGFSMGQRKQFARTLATAGGLRAGNPRVGHDPVLQRWWGRAHRLGSSPEALARAMEFGAETDIEPLLQNIRVPTLVLHRRDNRVWDIETSRAAAARIPNCRFVELPGSESELFLGETAQPLAEIIRFLRQEEAAVGDERPLATVLFTDIVASTEQLTAVGDRAWRHVLDEHDEAIGRMVSAHRGRVVRTTGDGTLATFDGPARAVRCAVAIRDTLADHGITVRAGLHTGEIELRGADVAGIAVHIASRVSALADPGEILVTRTVVDLTGGSDITYDSRGDSELKGVPGATPIFAAQMPA
jgi:class 3 adenylate cyclase